MPENNDYEWVKSTTNELNNLLQMIQESVQQLERTVNVDEKAARYFEILRNSIERSVAVTRKMQEHAAPPEPTPSFLSKFGSGAEETESSAGEPLKIANPEGERELVLIVDDEEFVTLLAQRVLTDEGYRVIVANNGFKALDIYRRVGDQIDLVILDFTMPVIDGSEVFSELRLLDPDVAVVLSSGFTEQEKLRWMLSKGLRGFLPKPYTQTKLLAQIRSVLDSIQNGKKD